MAGQGAFQNLSEPIASLSLNPGTNIPPIMENQMEKKMENEMETLGPFKGVYRENTPIMENQMEKNMENEMETGVI